MSKKRSSATSNSSATKSKRTKPDNSTNQYSDSDEEFLKKYEADFVKRLNFEKHQKLIKDHQDQAIRMQSEAKLAYKDKPDVVDKPEVAVVSKPEVVDKPEVVVVSNPGDKPGDKPEVAVVNNPEDKPLIVPPLIIRTQPLIPHVVIQTQPSDKSQRKRAKKMTADEEARMMIDFKHEHFGVGEDSPVTIKTNKYTPYVKIPIKNVQIGQYIKVIKHGVERAAIVSRIVKKFVTNTRMLKIDTEGDPNAYFYIYPGHPILNIMDRWCLPKQNDGYESVMYSGYVYNLELLDSCHNFLIHDTGVMSIANNIHKHSGNLIHPFFCHDIKFCLDAISLNKVVDLSNYDYIIQPVTRIIAGIRPKKSQTYLQQSPLHLPQSPHLQQSPPQSPPQSISPRLPVSPQQQEQFNRLSSLLMMAHLQPVPLQPIAPIQPVAPPSNLFNIPFNLYPRLFGGGPAPPGYYHSVPPYYVPQAPHQSHEMPEHLRKHQRN